MAWVTHKQQFGSLGSTFIFGTRLRLSPVLQANWLEKNVKDVAEFSVML